MAQQIGANSWAGESILGPNLHSEEQELNLISFPSILHFGLFFPLPQAFGGLLRWRTVGEHYRVTDEVLHGDSKRGFVM